MPSRRADVWIALGLLACAWAVRLLFASQLPFPPLDDPAFYVQTARNLAAGRGLVSDVLWSYQFPFAQVTHPSHEYWMPLATLLMAPVMGALGDGQLVAQLPGTLCGALLVPLTYGLGRMVEPADRRKALLAAGLRGGPPIHGFDDREANCLIALCEQSEGSRVECSSVATRADGRRPTRNRWLTPGLSAEGPRR
jgi:4-amino-4-deoxy-L-arabinose transferase-like glycosyltransferase